MSVGRVIARLSHKIIASSLRTQRVDVLCFPDLFSVRSSHSLVCRAAFFFSFNFSFARRFDFLFASCRRFTSYIVRDSFSVDLWKKRVKRVVVAFDQVGYKSRFRKNTFYFLNRSYELSKLLCFYNFVFPFHSGCKMSFSVTVGGSKSDENLSEYERQRLQNISEMKEQVILKFWIVSESLIVREKSFSYFTLFLYLIR